MNSFTGSVIRPDDYWLDYTTVTRPLSLAQIDTDLVKLAMSYGNHEPTKLVMWEYQWDWLTKGVDNSGSGRGTPNRAYGYKAIFGVKVEFA